MNKQKLIARIIAEDNNHQAHPIKELLTNAATINKKFTIALDATEDGTNWTNGTIRFDNSQVVPFYVPSSRMFSVDIITSSPIELVFNTASVLSKF